MDSRLALTDPDNRVYYCPHCKRPVSAHKDALSDEWLFTSRGAAAGTFFKLPAMYESTVGGVSALGLGAVYTYYAFPAVLSRIERRMPRWHGTAIPPLIASVPVGLGLAVTAGLARAAIPGIVELGLQLYFGVSESVFGLTIDAKRRLAAAQLERKGK